LYVLILRHKTGY